MKKKRTILVPESQNKKVIVKRDIDNIVWDLRSENNLCDSNMTPKKRSASDMETVMMSALSDNNEHHNVAKVLENRIRNLENANLQIYAFLNSINY